MKVSFYANTCVGLEGHFFFQDEHETIYTGCIDFLCVRVSEVECVPSILRITLKLILKTGCFSAGHNA